MAAESVSIKIRGREFRVRTDEDPKALQRIADYLNETMDRVEKRTGTVDSLDVALLTALNLARELVEIREGRGGASRMLLETKQLRPLIEVAERAIAAEAG